MTPIKHQPAAQSNHRGRVKAPYSPPRLEILGSLRSATRGTGGALFDGANNRRVMMSDRGAKQDIARIGEHPLGLGIYQFRYRAPFVELHGTGRRIGVMADEVAEKYPDAVFRDPDGYLRVDYGRLFH